MASASSSESEPEDDGKLDPHAMRSVPRHAFVPRDLRSQAYDDVPLPIGAGQTISQPYVVAASIEALALGGSERVLEVGAGTGYQAAVLSVLAREVIALGFRAYLSCVEGNVGPGFVGRAFDQSLLDDLPPGIDPCGENGEFHSFVYDGPIFKKPVPVTVGEIVIRDGRFYADLLPEALSTAARAATAMPPV